MAIRLSKRLTALANMVTDGNRLADIGTDHGYIPIYLCQTGKIPSALAVDIGKGRQQAQTHIAEHGLSEQIKTRLSDGMAALQSGEADTILIAGMGGGLVMKILSEGAEKLTGREELILQPQSEITLVREFLRMRNFQILDEDMILEDGKYYPMMKVIKQKAAEQTKDVPQNVADAYRTDFVTETASGSERMAGAKLKTTDTVMEQLSAQPDHERIRNRMQQVNCKKMLILEALKNYGTENVQSDDR